MIDITKSLTKEEYMEYLLKAFEKSKKYRGNKLDSRKEVVKSLKEYTLNNKCLGSTITSWGDTLRIEDFTDESKYGFPILVGVENDNSPVIFDIEENTNIAIAGVAGEGKSWLLELIIYNIVMQSHPGDANIILFNFKGDCQYKEISRIPHVIGCYNNMNNPEEYIEYLKEVCAEMNRRADLLRELGISKWSELRKRFKDDSNKRYKFPWLFVLMDETQEILYALESIDKNLRDEYVRLVKDISKQSRSLGIRIIMISQRTTNREMPREFISECSVKFAFRLNETDLDRIDMLNTGVIPPKEKGIVIFKEELLVEPILIKALGIGGITDFQIQNLLRMIAFEWHLRIDEEEIKDNLRMFSKVNNWDETRKEVIKDLREENYFKA